jgi:hypothetical protein
MTDPSLRARALLAQLKGTHPLVRPSDRFLARLAVVLVMVALLAVPVVATYGSASSADKQDAAVELRDTRFRVTAVLVEDAPPTRPVYPDVASASSRNEVAATWTAPSGATREETVSVAGGTEAGTEVDIWVDQFGNQASAPPPTDQAGSGAIVEAFGLWVLLTAGLAGFYWLARARCTHTTSTEWERQWRQIDEPWRAP